MEKLELGRVVVTIGVNEESKHSEEFQVFIQLCLNRHQSGDWGDLSEDDKKSNDYSLENNGRILSSYDIPEEMDISECKLWFITEWDRSVTTALFPSEY